MRYFVAVRRAPCKRPLSPTADRHPDAVAVQLILTEPGEPKAFAKHPRNPNWFNPSDPRGAVHAVPRAGGLARSPRDQQQNFSNADRDQPSRDQPWVRITSEPGIARRCRLASAMHFPIIDMA